MAGPEFPLFGTRGGRALSACARRETACGVAGWFSMQGYLIIGPFDVSRGPECSGDWRGAGERRGGRGGGGRKRRSWEEGRGGGGGCWGIADGVGGGRRGGERGGEENALVTGNKMLKHYTDRKIDTYGK